MEGFSRLRRTAPPAGSPNAWEINPSYKLTGAEHEAAKALKKQLDGLHTQEKNLLQQGDSTMKTLAVNTQIQVGFRITVKSLFSENHPGQEAAEN